MAADDDLSDVEDLVGTLSTLTTKQSLRLAMQRAVETQVVRLFEVWSGNVHQIGEAEAYQHFGAGLRKVAGARDHMMRMIDEM